MSIFSIVDVFISLYIKVDLLVVDVRCFRKSTIINILSIDLIFVWSIQPAKCNTSDLNEELGNVEFLFSDKTGTLTENVMIFRECSIDGSIFRDQEGNLVGSSTPSDRLRRSVRRFLEVLALCHTVQVFPNLNFH
jgi:P-type E1-E2 ATPase